MVSSDHGFDLVFSFNGIVVAACIASVPFYIWQAQVALSEVDRDLEDSARTEGAGEMGVFRFITVPLASRGIIAGVVLTFARALGDFGTTLMVGGNIPGMTHTLPLAVYDAWQADQHKIAQGASLLLASIALVISVSAARLTRKPDSVVAALFLRLVDQFFGVDSAGGVGKVCERGRCEGSGWPLAPRAFVRFWPRIALAPLSWRAPGGAIQTNVSLASFGFGVTFTV